MSPPFFCRVAWCRVVSFCSFFFLLFPPEGSHSWGDDPGDPGDGDVWARHAHKKGGSRKVVLCVACGTRWSYHTSLTVDRGEGFDGVMFCFLGTGRWLDVDFCFFSVCWEHRARLVMLYFDVRGRRASVQGRVKDGFVKKVDHLCTRTSKYTSSSCLFFCFLFEVGKGSCPLVDPLHLAIYFYFSCWFCCSFCCFSSYKPRLD